PTTGTRQLDATIAGVIDINGTAILLNATHPASGTSWTFVGEIEPSQEIELGDFIAYLLNRFGVNVPEAVNSFAITDLGITFVTGTRAFTYHSAGQFQIA